MIQTTPNQPKLATLPWRVIVDTAEQFPFTFGGITPRGRNRVATVETVQRCLGRHPRSYGDYSLESADGSWNAIGYCAVERKSCEDFQSTILEYAETHHAGVDGCRFASELANLRRINKNGGASLLVVEASLEHVLASIRQRGVRERQTLASTILGAVESIAQEYHIIPLFAGSRRLAELVTFRFLERYWKHHGPKRKGRKENVSHDGTTPSLFN